MMGALIPAEEIIIEIYNLQMVYEYLQHQTRLCYFILNEYVTYLPMFEIIQSNSKEIKTSVFLIFWLGFVMIFTNKHFFCDFLRGLFSFTTFIEGYRMYLQISHVQAMQPIQLQQWIPKSLYHIWRKYGVIVKNHPLRKNILK